MHPPILLIHNDPKIAPALHAELQRDGFPVTWARSGREAIESLRNDPIAVCLVDEKLVAEISDMKALLDKLHRTEPNMRIIVALQKEAGDAALSLLKYLRADGTFVPDVSRVESFTMVPSWVKQFVQLGPMGEREQRLRGVTIVTDEGSFHLRTDSISQEGKPHMFGQVNRR